MISSIAYCSFYDKSFYVSQYNILSNVQTYYIQHRIFFMYHDYCLRRNLNKYIQIIYCMMYNNTIAYNTSLYVELCC